MLRHSRTIGCAEGDRCKRSYGDAHWEQRAGQAVAKLQVSLYGLPIVKNRSVSYADIDPIASREIFITHALVRHEYTTKGFATCDANWGGQAEVVPPQPSAATDAGASAAAAKSGLNEGGATTKQQQDGGTAKALLDFLMGGSSQ